MFYQYQETYKYEGHQVTKANHKEYFKCNFPLKCSENISPNYFREKEIAIFWRIALYALLSIKKEC